MNINPDYTNQEWNIREADNCVRAILSFRHNIGHYYTSLEAYTTESIWKHVVGSSVGHSIDKVGALSRIERLLSGEWKFFKNIEELK